MANLLAAFMIVVGVVGTIVGLSFVLSWPVMWLINHNLSQSFIQNVFGVSQVGWLHAWGISALCSILFKSSNSSSSK
jgi:cell division protein FtsX